MAGTRMSAASVEGEPDVTPSENVLLVWFLVVLVCLVAAMLTVALVRVVGLAVWEGVNG